MDEFVNQAATAFKNVKRHAERADLPNVSELTIRFSQTRMTWLLLVALASMSTLILQSLINALPSGDCIPTDTSDFGVLPALTEANRTIYPAHTTPQQYTHRHVVTLPADDRPPAQALSQPQVPPFYDKVQDLQDLEVKWEKEFHDATVPMTNVTSCLFGANIWRSGYRNQMMGFTAMMIDLVEMGCDQIFFSNHRHKDLYGTEKAIAHEFLYDVVHWNTFYPKLPKMVRCEQSYFPELDCKEGSAFFKQDPRGLIRFEDDNKNGVPMKRFILNATLANTTNKLLRMVEDRDYALFRRYMEYSKGKRHPVDLLMMQQAHRPHPRMQRIIEASLAKKMGGSDKQFMTFHARVEPDVFNNPKCSKSKIVNLTRIVEMVEAHFLDPPAPFVFMPINRAFMERTGVVNVNGKKMTLDDTNAMATENLATLNRISSQGLWEGRAKIFELGAYALNGTAYAARPSTSGAMMNYYIAMQGNVYIGSVISSWAVDLLATKFYRGNRQNYMYSPNGIERWTNDTTELPPNFGC